MLDVKKILFPTDFSVCADQAFLQAIYFAKMFNAELFIMHSCLLPEVDSFSIGHYLPDIEKEKALLKNHVKEQLQSVMKRKEAEHIKIHSHQEVAVSPADSIADFARHIDADMIIMGTHGRRGFSQAFMGSVTEKVVRLSHCPVITVKDEHHNHRRNKLLVPIDFSPSSRQALKVAKLLAEISGSELLLINIVSYSLEEISNELSDSMGPQKIPDLIDKRKMELVKLFDQIPGPNVNYSCHTKLGAAYEIIKFADEYGVDMIITSTHGSIASQDFLIGGTSEKVIRASHCPVLVLKTFGKSLVKIEETA